jgi:hypothetical protein
MCKPKVKADRDKSAGRGDVIYCGTSDVFPKVYRTALHLTFGLAL